jgi:hypothetical protein
LSEELMNTRPYICVQLVSLLPARYSK